MEKFLNYFSIIMRVYFEKPRTTVGWKGLINDPHLDNSFQINQGLRVARKLLVDLADLGVPTATEFLDTIIPQFISDAISWGAIGARTTESQIHRELASGLSMPVGFKNGTDGNIQIALDAICSAANSHHFLSVTKQGIPAIVNTKGNDCCHLILRGAQHGPNYSVEHVADASHKLMAMKLNSTIMVDCSHGNSQKNHENQKYVVENIASQLEEGNSAVSGVMIESNLVSGRQDLKSGAALHYGKSITDACIDWNETEVLLEKLAKAVCSRRKTAAQKNGE
jgi:3-deoxy-7-phosphoheptulonate synthase